MQRMIVIDKKVYLFIFIEKKCELLGMNVV